MKLTKLALGLSLFLPFTARASSPVDAATPLVNISSSPATPTQNQDLTWVVQFDAPFTSRLLSIEAKLNGVAVPKIQTMTRNVFLIPLGLQTEAGVNTLTVTLYAENTANNTDIRNAIASIGSDIYNLSAQINAQRDPVKRALLVEQRNEKVALQNELYTQLKKFRYKMGDTTKTYFVQPDASLPGMPFISNITPVAGSVHGGSLVTIYGANFYPSATVKFGGIASPDVRFVDSHTLKVITPDFGTNVGAKDIELRFTTTPGTLKIVSPGAFTALAPIPFLTLAADKASYSVGDTPVISAAIASKPDNSELEFDLVTKLNGSEVANLRSSDFNFSSSLAGLTAGTYSYTADVVLQNRATGEDLKAAIGSYKNQIHVIDVALQTETDPAKIAQLEANRSQLVSQQSTAQDELSQIRTHIYGPVTISFQVQ